MWTGSAKPWKHRGVSRISQRPGKLVLYPSVWNRRFSVDSSSFMITYHGFPATWQPTHHFLQLPSAQIWAEAEMLVFQNPDSSASLARSRTNGHGALREMTRAPIPLSLEMWPSNRKRKRWVSHSGMTCVATQA